MLQQQLKRCSTSIINNAHNTSTASIIPLKPAKLTLCNFNLNYPKSVQLPNPTAAPIKMPRCLASKLLAPSRGPTFVFIFVSSLFSSFFFFEERKEAKNGEKIFALTREHWGVFDDPNLGMLLRVISRSTCLRLMKDRSDTKLWNNQSSKRLFQFDETNERG